MFGEPQKDLQIWNDWGSSSLPQEPLLYWSNVDTSRARSLGNTFRTENQILAQLNFRGLCEKETLWQCLLLQLYQTLNNLTLPEQFCIPFPKPAGGTHPSPAGGHLPKIWQKQIRDC